MLQRAASLLNSPPPALPEGPSHVFNNLFGVLQSGAAFVIVLGVLVFVHEFGHYAAARWRGVHVEVFSIGFGKAIASWQDRVGTTWKLAWLPLGGYVKLHGLERPETVSDETRASWIAGRTFHDKQIGSRAIVVAAGPAANFLLAAVLFAVLFATVGQQVMLPVVADVQPGSAAAAAGLQTADRIEAIDGVATPTFLDIQRIVSLHPGAKLALTVRRGDAEQTLTATIGSRDAGDGTQVGILGIRSGEVAYHRLNPLAAVGQGVVQTWEVTSETFTGVAQMISGRRGTEELGGPLRIAQLSGQVAQLGLASLMSFIAILSVNLGLINLFPIPVLDGGHLVFYLAEAIRGRPVPVKAQEYGFRAGLALLASLFVFATWNDLTHLGIVHWVAGLFG
jgi:regulator of sigma E protease